jgi:CubicO group peptidase (beta-lactamase class C family)
MLRRTALNLLPAAAIWPLRADRPEDPREVIEAAVAKKQIPGAIVAVRQHGKIIFETVAGLADIESGRKMRVDDVCMIASSTKPWAASTVMTVVDSGRLGLDDRVSKYFPEFAGTSTIRQCLCHTSGIFGNDGPKDTLRWIRNFDLSLKDAVSHIVRQPLVYNPGDKFDYGGASFCVVGRIVEMLTGMEFDAYMKQVLWDPLALNDTMYRTTRDITARVPRLYDRTDSGFKPMDAVMETAGHRGPRPGGFILVPGGI